MPKVYACVYGCPTNISDYETSLGMLKDAGFEIVSSEKESDVNIIFTCIVKTPTEKRMVRRIQELSGTGKPLVVAGCMSNTSQRKIENINPNASLLGSNSIAHVVDAVESAFDGKKVMFVRDCKHPKPSSKVRKRDSIGIVPIATGCMSNCSYCSVKLARGNLKSLSVDDIVKEIESLLKDGCDQIWLTSQDNGCYGLDIGEDLAALLKRICDIDGEFDVRVGMMNPTYIKGKMLDAIVSAYKNDKIRKFIHIPVQSGSDRILKRMRRGYTVEDFENIFKQFKKDIPDISITTDIIVGFPGETEDDFKKTIELIQQIKPNKVNISRFGARPNTDAAKMEQVPVNVINERSKELYKIISGDPNSNC